jgi:hypothetical protein
MELDRQTYSRENEQVTQAQPEPAPTVREETQIAENRATPPPAPAPAEDTGRMETLPRTASPMPLFGFAGLLALGAGMAFRAVGRN